MQRIILILVVVLALTGVYGQPTPLEGDIETEGAECQRLTSHLSDLVQTVEQGEDGHIGKITALALNPDFREYAQEYKEKCHPNGGKVVLTDGNNEEKIINLSEIPEPNEVIHRNSLTSYKSETIIANDDDDDDQSDNSDSSDSSDSSDGSDSGDSDGGSSEDGDDSEDKGELHEASDDHEEQNQHDDGGDDEHHDDEEDHPDDGGVLQLDHGDDSHESGADQSGLVDVSPVEPESGLDEPHSPLKVELEQRLNEIEDLKGLLAKASQTIAELKSRGPKEENQIMDSAAIAKEFRKASPIHENKKVNCFKLSLVAAHSKLKRRDVKALARARILSEELDGISAENTRKLKEFANRIRAEAGAHGSTKALEVASFADQCADKYGARRVHFPSKTHSPRSSHHKMGDDDDNDDDDDFDDDELDDIFDDEEVEFPKKIKVKPSSALIVPDSLEDKDKSRYSYQFINHKSSSSTNDSPSQEYEESTEIIEDPEKGVITTKTTKNGNTHYSKLPLEPSNFEFRPPSVQSVQSVESIPSLFDSR